MSVKFIPENIDPYRFAEQGLSIDGLVKIADMPRLSTTAGGETVSVDLQFGLDEQGVTFLKGHLQAQLILQCQRCMESYSYEIVTNFLLGIVNSLDEANSLPEQYEPVLTKEGHLALREMIEDEIILNLPLIPKHDANSCKVQLSRLDSEWEQKEANNPFRVLELLKHNQKESGES